MFGEESVPKIFKGEKLYVTVDGKKANIDLLNLVSATTGVYNTAHIVQLTLYKTLIPVAGGLL